MGGDLLVAATAIYFGDTAAATNTYVCDAADPSTGGTWVIYFDPKRIREDWSSEAIASYSAPDDVSDAIQAGNIKIPIILEGCSLLCSGTPPTYLEYFKRAFSKFSRDDTLLYYWEKNGDGENLGQWSNSTDADVEQMRVKLRKVIVYEKAYPHWYLNIYLERFSPATALT